MNVAIIGSGPSAFYTVQSFLRENININIDIFEKHPAPFGLVRYGVAPDHQKTKNIIRLFSKYLLEKNINFYGNVEIGKDINIDFLSKIYDVVVISTGAPKDKKLNIVGENLLGSYGSAEFVGWYNGNPDFVDIKPNLNTKNAVIIGNGNVALDCARILSKTEKEFSNSDIMDYSLKVLKSSKIENIFIIGRRTPQDAKFTIAELRELGELLNFKPDVEYNISDLELILNIKDIDTKIKKNIEVLKSFKSYATDKKKRIIFKFLHSPLKIMGENQVRSIILKKNKFIDKKIIETENIETIDTNLVITAIGYKVSSFNNLKLDSKGNFFYNNKGHIKDNIYTNGWASGASVGVIGTNKIGASILVKKILEEIKSNKPYVNETILDYMNNKKIKFINKDNWFKIDNIELNTSPNHLARKKLVNINEILQKITI